MTFDYTPPTYTAEELDHMAKHGTLRERLTAASRTNLPKETLAWMLENDDSDEVRSELVSRGDVTPERLVKIASVTENANLLGRIAGIDFTPLETVKAIMEKADAREGIVWTSLAAYAGRVIRLREFGESEFLIRGKLPDTERRAPSEGS
jgi:hypothetical protein